MEDVRCVIVESIEAKISVSGYIHRSPLDSPLYRYTHTPLPPPRSIPSSTTSSDPHRDRKVGINVNRMSARPRKTALQWCIKGVPVSLAISTSPPREFFFLSSRTHFLPLYSFLPFSRHLSSARRTSLLLDKNRPHLCREILERNDPSPTMIYQLDHKLVFHHM